MNSNRKLCDVATICELTAESFLISTVQSAISRLNLIPLAIPTTGPKLFALDLVEIDLFATYCQIRTWRGHSLFNYPPPPGRL